MHDADNACDSVSPTGSLPMSFALPFATVTQTP